MMNFFLLGDRFGLTNEPNKENAINEKELLSIFAENMYELRAYCKLSLMELGKELDIPNQTLSTYENKVHVPSMLQAMKIASYFGLTIEEFIACGFDEYPYDITELYERKKKGL